MTESRIESVFGVDYSGAAMSGQTAWLAECKRSDDGKRLVLASLKPIGKLAGSDDRTKVNSFLVATILASANAFWGMDFPFGLPIELGLGSWGSQMRFVKNYPGTAKDLGRHLVKIAQQAGHAMHIRRTTDRETKTPFDCYHYRIIYQTYFGMRDVLAPLARDQRTCVLPFQYKRMHQAKRYVVEACPSSTLKRFQLPYRLYKQSGGKPPTEPQKELRKQILAHLTHRLNGYIAITASQRQMVLQNPGGDALDAVLAAVGSFADFCSADHSSIHKHLRYRLEGRVFG